MKSPRIFLDMDGVLVDFVNHACKFHGSTITEQEWPEGEWDIAKVLGIGSSSFWKKLNCQEFWNDMPIYSHTEQLIEACKATGYPVTILSSPAFGPSASCKYEFARHKLKLPIILANDKTPLAHGPYTLLIDDHDKNIEAWHEAGGFSHLFPRKWNAAHKHHDNALKITLELLERWVAHVALIQKG